MQRTFLDVAIDPFPQIARTFKRHDPPRRQHHIFTSGRVPAPAFTFLIHAEFTEPTDQNILPGGQCRLDVFKEVLYEFCGLVSGESDLCLDCLYDVCLCQCHMLRLSILSLVDIGTGGDVIA